MLTRLALAAVAVLSMLLLAPRYAEGAAPANDDFSNAETLSGLPVSTSGTIVEATAESGEPAHAGLPPEFSVWYSWTAPSTTPVALNFDGSALDGRYGVYVGGPGVGDLAEVTSGTFNAAGGFEGVSGTTYFIAVDRANDIENSFNLTIETGSSISGTVEEADTSNPVEGACVSATRTSDFLFGFTETDVNGDYSLQGLPDGDYIVAFGGCSGYLLRQYYDGAGDFDSGTPVSVSSGDTITGIDGSLELGGMIVGTITDELSNPLGLMCVFVFTDEAEPKGLGTAVTGTDGSYSFLTPAGSHLVLFRDCFGGSDYAEEAFDDKPFSVTAADPVTVTAGADTEASADLAAIPPPANDDFGSAEALEGALASSSGYNDASSSEAGEPDHAGTPASRSAWYSWRASESGPVTIDLEGSDFDTRLAVYTGSSVGGLTPVASNDNDPGGGSDDFTSKVEFAAAENTTYRIAVDGANSRTGDIGLELTGTDTTPPDTIIDSGPFGTLRTARAEFTFHGQPAADTAKIQCKLDDEPYEGCESPLTLTGLTDGVHEVRFRAEDSFGNQDPTPATRTMIVDISAPQCSDALDNDADGKTDFPADPGCTGPLDNDETDPLVPPPADTDPPTLRLTGKKKQSSKKKVVVKASCDEACKVVVRPKGKATVETRAPVDAAKRKKRKLKLKTAKANLTADQSKKLELKFKGKKTKKLVKRTLRRKKGKITLKLKGTATDAAGNRGRDSFKVNLKR